MWPSYACPGNSRDGSAPIDSDASDYVRHMNGETGDRDASSEPARGDATFAYFIIPMPEPMGMPEGIPFPHEEFEDDHAYLRRLAEEQPPSDASTLGPASLRQISVVWHQVGSLPSDYLGVMTLLEVAEKVLPWAMGGRRAGRRIRAQRTIQRWMQRRRRQRFGGLDPVHSREMTIAELAVSVDLNTSDEEGELTDAFEAGLAWIQRLQEAHYVVRRMPISMCTRETLPPFVPFAAGKFRDDGPPEEVRGMGVFALHNNMSRVVRDETLTSSETQLLAIVLHMSSIGHPFFAYLASSREAEVALLHRGDYRASVLATATGAESILDGLLLHLLWEDCVSPERAADIFSRRAGIKGRLSGELASMLGGRWTAEQPGPVQDWQTNIAAVRHRTIHGGYRPNLLEANTALSTLQNLEGHLIGRLTDTRNLGRFPLTALALVGLCGLERRGLANETLNTLASSEPETAPLFARWRDLVNRQRLNTNGVAVTPRTERAVLMAVISPGVGYTWVLHDKEAGMAALATPPDLGDMDEVIRGLETLTAEIAQAESSLPVSVAWAQNAHGSHALENWVLDYRLVPEAAVMRDGSDPSLRVQA